MSDPNAPQHDPGSGVKEADLTGLIGATLRYGVLISAAVVLIGYLALVRGGLPTRHFDRFTGHAAPGRYGVIDVVTSLHSHGTPADIITLGLILLILTPVVRVAMSWVIFLYEHDRLYARLTMLVLAILVFSLLGGSQ